MRASFAIGAILEDIDSVDGHVAALERMEPYLVKDLEFCSASLAVVVTVVGVRTVCGVEAGKF
ncbi:hypothetical protein ES702_03710 [subsurface metagenome]